MLWKLRDDLKRNCNQRLLKDLLDMNGINCKGGESDVCLFARNPDIEVDLKCFSNAKNSCHLLSLMKMSIRIKSLKNIAQLINASFI